MKYCIDAVIAFSIPMLMDIQLEIAEAVWEDPDRSFEPLVLKKQQKQATTLDVVAEWRAAEQLRKEFRSLNPLILGEESLSLGVGSLARHDGLVFLLDIVDGTRLCQFGSFEWCSAMICFDPGRGQIVMAAVVLPSGIAYFASREGAGKCRRHEGTLEYAAIAGPSQERSAAKASIAFYGYNARRFVAMRDRFPHWLEPGILGGESNPNVFVVGGNPALVHMIDGYRKIDAVIEPFGQALHDMLAGGYISRQAGATIVDGHGQPLDMEGLLARDLSTKVTYIAAGTPELATQLQKEMAELRPAKGAVSSLTINNLTDNFLGIAANG